MDDNNGYLGKGATAELILLRPLFILTRIEANQQQHRRQLALVLTQICCNSDANRLQY